jgi:hypothetical protein
VPRLITTTSGIQTAGFHRLVASVGIVRCQTASCPWSSRRGFDRVPFPTTRPRGQRPIGDVFVFGGRREAVGGVRAFVAEPGTDRVADELNTVAGSGRGREEAPCVAEIEPEKLYRSVQRLVAPEHEDVVRGRIEATRDWVPRSAVRFEGRLDDTVYDDLEEASRAAEARGHGQTVEASLHCACRPLRFGAVSALRSKRPIKRTDGGPVSGAASFDPGAICESDFAIASDEMSVPSSGA